MLQIRAESGGSIDLSSLTSESNVVQYRVLSGERLTFGSLIEANPDIEATGLESRLEVNGNFVTGPDTRLLVRSGAKLSVSVNFSTHR